MSCLVSRSISNLRVVYALARRQLLNPVTMTLLKAFGNFHVKDECLALRNLSMQYIFSAEERKNENFIGKKKIYIYF